MSIINKMLQDLDRRQGLSDPDATTAMPQVRTVAAPRGDREWFWRIVAVLLVASVAWVAWIAWQLQPRESPFTDLAVKAQVSPRPAAAPTAETQPAEPKPAAKKAEEPKPLEPKPEEPKPAETKPAEAAPAEAKPAPAVVAEAVKPPAPVVDAPRPEATKAEAKPQVKAAPEAKAASAAKPKPAPVIAAAPSPKLSSLDVPPARILQAPAQAQGSVKLEKRDRVRSGQERAEAEFRRGAGLLNQGRGSEAEEAFAAALAASPTHEPARQALVAVALEQQRIDEARRLLQEGVALNPGNARFASVLARVHIERKDYASALEVLNGVRPPPQGDAEFQAMRGTVLQRLGRHAEAAAAFQASLRGGSPNNGALWIGLGVSLEALGRRPEAAEAFQRAAATGTLSTEARNYAEQRARQLQ